MKYIRLLLLCLTLSLASCSNGPLQKTYTGSSAKSWTLAEGIKVDTGSEDKDIVELKFERAEGEQYKALVQDMEVLVSPSDSAVYEVKSQEIQVTLNDTSYKLKIKGEVNFERAGEVVVDLQASPVEEKLSGAYTFTYVGQVQ